MNNWLTENEVNWIPLSAMVILDDLVRENRPIIFDNVEGEGIVEDGKNVFWMVRVNQTPLGWGLGGSLVPLYRTQYQPQYMIVKDQITRYLRWLKSEVYPRYQVR